jgi:hypothetical protein
VAVPAQFVPAGRGVIEVSPGVIMRAHLLVATLLSTSVTIAACSSDNVLGLGVAGGNGDVDSTSSATVRVANATDLSIDVARGNASLGAGNAALGFGRASTCISTASASPDVVVRASGSVTPLAILSTPLLVGRSYTVVAFTDATNAVQLVSVERGFAPASGQAGLAVVNTTLGVAYDVFVTAPGASLAGVTPTVANVGTGLASSVVNVDATSPQQLRIAQNGAAVADLDLGNETFVPGQSMTLVIAQPAGQSLAVRAFLVAEC